MGYWDATDQIMRTSGAPLCPYCGKPMIPQDDHGRFACFCQGMGMRTFDAVTGITNRSPRIPQVDTTGMSNAEKVNIPPINRLYSAPTSAEEKFLSLLLQGPDAMDTPEYRAAREALEKEREHK